MRRLRLEIAPGSWSAWLAVPLVPSCSAKSPRGRAERRRRRVGEQLMAKKPVRPGRTLMVFFIGVAIAFGLVALNGSWKPSLGLDLQGETGSS